MSKKFSSVEFNQLLNNLFALQRLGIKTGLEHTRKLLEACGNPQNDFSAIHIAGTNGKGSTAAMLASILRAAGVKVGLYTSPHLIKFNERIRVNGVPISDENIVNFMSQYKTAIDKIESTFFETTTAMAFNYFKENEVDVAIVETGLGGRLDSTNVLEPVLTIITPIASDHTEILGKKLRLIATEKGGIIKKNVPLILAQQYNNVLIILNKIAKTENAKIIYCGQSDIKKILISESGTTFQWRGISYHTGLIGEHQAENAVLAIEAANIYHDNIKLDSITNGLSNVDWPARLQKVDQKSPIYYDVAHNPQGIKIMLKTLNKMYSKKPIGLMVLKADKELDKIAPILKNRFKELIITGKPESGLMSANELYKSLLRLGIKGKLEPDIIEAIKLVNRSVSELNPGIIFGSHYIGDTIFNEYGFFFDNGII